jgi:hypothetical protein
MKNTDTLEPLNKFSYRIDFRYKKFDKELKLSDFIESVVVISVDEPVPEPLERNWISIIEALNPNYYKIELINVKANNNEI